MIKFKDILKESGIDANPTRLTTPDINDLFREKGLTTKALDSKYLKWYKTKGTYIIVTKNEIEGNYNVSSIELAKRYDISKGYRTWNELESEDNFELLGTFDTETEASEYMKEYK